MRLARRKQKLVAEINIAPFTDVILVLLIIFMITTPLISQSSIKVNLPRVESGKSSGRNPQEQAEVSITRENMVYLDGKLVTRKELKGSIAALYKDNPSLSVVVRADKFVKFQEIVNILDPLTELGIIKLNIAVIKDE